MTDIHRGGTLQEQLTAMYEQLQEPGLDSMDFMVARPPELQKPGTTVSKDALAELAAAVNTFIAARISHHWDARPGGSKEAIGPAVIKATVSLTIDDVHVEPHEDRRPWYVVDGQARP